MSATALPTLSEVRAFTGDYLINAASHWSVSAARWSDAYDRLTREVAAPAGAEWRGDAADAAARRIGEDRERVNSAVGELTVAASTARRAIDDLRAAKEKLLKTVRAAEAAGFEVGQDFSITSVENTTSAKELAAREAQMRSLGVAIRSDVLALVKADQLAAAPIIRAATGLQTLHFRDNDGVISDRGMIEAVDFHGAPLPEKPPNPPAIPPPEGWSSDPIMRAAQKIAYGHASDPDTGHMGDFPGMNQAELAELIHQKMQRAMTDSSGLILGYSNSDGVPVIYDPEDNVLIIRDTRPIAPDGGTVFKKVPSEVGKKFGSYTSAFTRQELADAITELSPGTKQGGFGIPGAHLTGSVDTATRNDEPSRTLPSWGTHISPEEAAKHDGEIGNLGKIVLGQVPPTPGPGNTA
jgi:hypothetical protein